MSHIKANFASSINSKNCEDNGKRPGSAVSRTLKPSFSNYIFPNRYRQNLRSKEFSPFLMIVKSLEKEKPNQEGFDLKPDQRIIKTSRSTLPVAPKHNEIVSIFTRPGTARTINSDSCAFKFGKLMKCPDKKGLELNKEGKNNFSSYRGKQLSFAESEDLTIQAKELSKFTDFNYSTPQELTLYPSMKLMPSFRSLEKSESYGNFGIKITSKPLTARDKCRSYKIFK